MSLCPKCNRQRWVKLLQLFFSVHLQFRWRLLTAYYRDEVTDGSGPSIDVAEGRVQPPSVPRGTRYIHQEVLRPGLPNTPNRDSHLLGVFAALEVFQDRCVADPLRRLYQYRLKAGTFWPLWLTWCRLRFLLPEVLPSKDIHPLLRLFWGSWPLLLRLLGSHHLWTNGWLPYPLTSFRSGPRRQLWGRGGLGCPHLRHTSSSAKLTPLFWKSSLMGKNIF